jgi:hypothetical protein
MRPMLKLALLIALSLAVQPLHAQMLGPSWETNVTLSQGDLDMIKAALADQIHGKKLGATAAWMNPASGNSGTITLLDISARNGRRCERIEYRASPPNKTAPSDRFALLSCLQADGSWKLSE